jgi:hypothetical protein
MKTSILWLAAAAILLGACASDPTQTSRRDLKREEYLRHAGEPVDRIRVLNIHGWTVIDREQLVIWTRPNEAFLFDLDAPCQNLEFARKIGISNFGSNIHSRFDALIVNRDRCRINSIRPIDTKALRAERKRMRLGGDLEDRPKE